MIGLDDAVVAGCAKIGWKWLCRTCNDVWNKHLENKRKKGKY